MVLANIKAFDFMGDDIVELSTENDFLRNELGSYDEKWYEESKTRLLKQFNVVEGTCLYMFQRQKQY